MVYVIKGSKKIDTTPKVYFDVDGQEFTVTEQKPTKFLECFETTKEFWKYGKANFVNFGQVGLE